MHDVTRILGAIEEGDPSATERLLPLVYDELRRLAAQKLAQEKPGQTLDATALVHEAYLRLVAGAAPGAGDAAAARWQGQRHFFAAAAEAMRRILVENARRKLTGKRGGARVRVDLDPDQIAAAEPDQDLVAVDEALTRLTTVDPAAAELVKLRYFAGLSIPQAAEILDIGARSADRLWTFARSWLFRELSR